MNNQNIMNDLNLIMLNIPDNLTPLEKARWVYIKSGELFSYDYNFLNDEESQVRYEEDYINRYETCEEISSILNLMLNNIDENIKSEVIERPLTIRGTPRAHKCNLITLNTGEKYILDLTLDLFLIQSGFQTKNFGFSTTIYGDEDILSLNECEEMDKKMGLIKFGEYTDKKINDAKSRINSPKNKDLSFQESVKLRIEEINKLMYKFVGFGEGKDLIIKLFGELMGYYFKEFYLTYDKEMITCLKVSDYEDEMWFIYSSKLGLMETTQDNISEMLDNGWQTKSTSLEEMLNSSSLK